MKKKLISFAVTAVMILSIFSFPSVNAVKSVDHNEYTKAGGVLSALGIEQNFDSDTLMLGTKITRLNFIKKVIGIVLPNGAKSENKYYFADITAEDDGYDIVAAAVDIGIISYYDGCEFRPNDALTYEEAAKILVCFMHYSAMADAKGGFPTGYILAAKELGLSDGVLGTDESFSHGDALMMIFNMLRLPAPTLGFGTDRRIKTKYVSGSGSTMMSVYFGVEEIYGTVSANYCTGIESADGTGVKGKIEITDKSGTVISLNAPGYDNLLGYSVNAFYKKDSSDGMNNIVYIEKYHNDELTVKGKNVVSYDSAENSICYTNAVNGADGTVRSEKNLKKKIPISANVIYNGQFTGDVEAALQRLNETDKYTVESISFIDNDKNGQCDAVLVDAYRTVVTDKAIDLGEEIQIVDYYGTDMVKLDTSESSMWVQIKNERLEDCDMLPSRSKGTVFSVFESMNSAKPVVKVICAETETMGSITAISEKSITVTPTEINPHSNTIVWNPEQYGYTDVEYALTDSAYKRLKDIPLGTSYYYVLRFDHNGNIAGAMEYTYLRAYKDTSTYVNVPFGIVSEVSVDEFADILTVKMFTFPLNENGYRMAIYNTSAHFSYNDKRVKNVDDYNWKDELRSKPITYRLNSNKEITQIHTASTTRKNGELAYSVIVPTGTSDFRYKSNCGIFYSNTTGKQIATANTETKFFVVPDDTVSDSDRDGYFRQAVRGHQFQNDLSYRVEGYTFREDSVISDIVLCYLGAGDDIGLKRYFVVDEVGTAINNKGEVCDMVSGMSNKTAGALTSAGSHFVDKDGKEIALKPGDVIRPYFDYDYDVIKVDRYYDMENNSIGSWTDTYGGSIDAYAGDVYAVDATAIAICPVAAEKSFENSRLYAPRSGMDIYVFDCGKKKEHVRTGSITEAVTAQKANGDCSRAFVFSANGEPQMFVIYNNVER